MFAHLHDILEILLMSIAIGMDSLSLSIGVGLNGLSRNEAYYLASMIGIFHVFMTLVGLTLGMALGSALGTVAKWFGAILLIGLGVHMIVGTLSNKQDKVYVGTTAPAVLLFSAGVSVDALSVGFSLGLRSTAYGLVSALSFGVMATIMCMVGIFIGKRAAGFAGVYGELIGAAILIGYGIHFIAA